MSILSGIVAGHRGQLTYVAHASDPATEVSDHDIFDWRLELRRRMQDITEVNQSVKQYWYSHSEAVIGFKAYVNQGAAIASDPFENHHPGTFNRTQPATIALWPDGDETNPQKRWIMEGWLEEMRIEVSIGTPNIIIGKVRVTGDVTIEWPQP